METNKYTPSSIDIRFRIPLYQRPYAWGEAQVKQLLNDLYEAKRKNENAYYIGILNVGKTESANLYDLIDGQQRITTLSLIGRVLKDFYPDWNKFLGRLDLYGRKEDQLYLEKLNESVNPNPNMITAIKTTQTFISEKRKDDEFNETNFSEYVYKNAAFFLSKVPDDYTIIDKNLQFVRMNNRGKQLEPTDILKIKLASVIENKEDQAGFIKNWNNISQLGCNVINNNQRDPKELGFIICSSKVDLQMDEKYKPNESEIFYQSIITFSEFLLIALDRFLSNVANDANVADKDKEWTKNFSHSYTKDKLLETFKAGDTKAWNSEKVIEFGKFLQAQYEIFVRFFIRRDKDDQRYTLYSEDDDEPFKIKNKEDSLTDLRKRILMFQSYLYVSREPKKWMKDAFDWIAENKDDKNLVPAEDFLAKLKKKDNEVHSLDYTKLSFSSIDRYWFWRLDYYLWENRKEQFENNETALKIAEKYVFRANRSIEHVAPQTPLQNSNIQWGTSDEDIKIMNSFGNLAMISAGQNSSLQNASFEMKKANVESFINGSKTGSIESLKMLKIYQEETWDKTKIQAHEQEMIKILEKSFSNAV